MKETNLSDTMPPAVTHTTCGSLVTWRLGNEARDGGPFCTPCDREVPVDELSHAGPFCVSTDVNGARGSTRS